MTEAPLNGAGAWEGGEGGLMRGEGQEVVVEQGQVEARQVEARQAGEIKKAEEKFSRVVSSQPKAQRAVGGFQGQHQALQQQHLTH